MLALCVVAPFLAAFAAILPSRAEAIAYTFVPNSKTGSLDVWDPQCTPATLIASIPGLVVSRLQARHGARHIIAQRPNNGEIVVIDSETLQIAATATPPPSARMLVYASPDGLRFYTSEIAPLQFVVQAFDTATATPIGQPTPFINGQFEGIAVTPDGSRLLAVSRDGAG